MNIDKESVTMVLEFILEQVAKKSNGTYTPPAKTSTTSFINTIAQATAPVAKEYVVEEAIKIETQPVVVPQPVIVQQPLDPIDTYIENAPAEEESADALIESIMGLFE